MLKPIINKLIVLGLIVFASALPFSAVYGQTSIADGVCRGILSTEGQTVDTEGGRTTASGCFEDGDKSFSQLVRNIINVFSIVVGAVSVIMIIIGGFRYIISGGDSAGVSAAKNTILYAIVGLVIVLFAQVIIRFVYTNVSPNTTQSPPASSQQQTD